MNLKSGISYVQLALLSLSVVFSGLALYEVSALTVMIGCAVFAAASASLGSLAARDGRGVRARLVRLFPRGAELAAAALAACASAPLFADALAFGRYTSEIYEGSVAPAIFFVAAAVVAAILSGYIKVMGRLAEIFGFFAFACVVLCLFGELSTDNLRLSGIESIAPLGSVATPLALCCEAELGADDGLSSPSPIWRSMISSSAGAFAGAALYAYVSLFLFRYGNVAETVLIWASGLLRISAEVFAVRRLCAGAHSKAIAAVFAVSLVGTGYLLAKKSLPLVTGATEILNVFLLLILFCLAIPSAVHVRKNA